MKPTVLLLRLTWPFYATGLVLIALAVALVAYEIHISTFIVSGWLVIALFVGGIGMIATGLTLAWEITHG